MSFLSKYTFEQTADHDPLFKGGYPVHFGMIGGVGMIGGENTNNIKEENTLAIPIGLIVISRPQMPFQTDSLNQVIDDSLFDNMFNSLASAKKKIQNIHKKTIKQTSRRPLVKHTKKQTQR